MKNGDISPSRLVGLRLASLGLSLLAIWCAGIASLIGAETAAKRKAPGEDREAQALVRELLSQRPEDLQLKVKLKLRDGDGRRSQIPVRYTIISGEQGWQGIYETMPPAFPEQLIVLHRGEQPNQYIYRKAKGAKELAAPEALEGDNAAIPFAGSDFWLADLGMEFLHWPGQRIVRDAKITMRLGRPCKVLESIHPNPSTKTYARVESWIDNEYGGLIYAVAYDNRGKPFKIFSLRGFEKVEGTTQVSEMEIQNEKTDSRTMLKFLYDSGAR